MNRRGLWIQLTLAVLLVLAGAGWLAWVGQQQAALANRPGAWLDRQTNRPAADFTLPGLQAETVSLSDYSGQVVLINFWATWCPPCTAELPAINTYYQAHQQQGLVVLAVNAEEDRTTVETFVERNKLLFPVLLDLDGVLMAQYDARALPVTIIVDREGIIRHVERGELTVPDLERLVGPLL